MKAFFKSVLTIILGLIVYSCTDKKEDSKINNLTLDNYDSIEAPPPKPDYLNDKKNMYCPM